MPQATADPAVRRLVDCPYFTFDDVQMNDRWRVGGDDACHLLTVLEGAVRLDERWSLPPLTRGSTLLLPAAIGPQTLQPAQSARLLHVGLPA